MCCQTTMEGKLWDSTKALRSALHFEVFSARCHFSAAKCLKAAGGVWSLLSPLDCQTVVTGGSVSLIGGVIFAGILPFFFSFFFFIKRKTPPAFATEWECLNSLQALQALIIFSSLSPLLEALQSWLWWTGRLSEGSPTWTKRGKYHLRECPPSFIFSARPSS